jgi:segregation and condensation protein A
MSLLNPTGADYTIHTEIYDGPLDLLLDLITKAELDITRFSLARVTDQFLAYLETMEDTSAVEVSGFLVVAAKLIQIKSEALLPRPPERIEGEEDPAESLARQLIIYKKVKQTALWLKTLEGIGQRTYIRLAPPPVIEKDLDLNGLSIDDLVEFLKSLYRYEEEASPITSVVTIPRRTIKKKIQDLLFNLRKKNQLSYRSFLSNSHDRIDAIVLFLAVLELIKQQYATANQTGLFSDIFISATEKIFQDEDIQLALD